MNLTETLKRLSAARGPSGGEDEVRALIIELLNPYMDQIYTDPLGNVIGVSRCGKKNAPRLVVETHMDEIGFVVTGAREGFLKLSALGGVDARHLPGARLRVLSQPELTGVITTMPPHILASAEMEKSISLEDMSLDVGLTQEEAEKILPGTPVVFEVKPMAIGEGAFTGKSLDNRASIAAVLLALEGIGDKLEGIDLYVLASTQEELGLRGAKTGFYSIKPDYCVCLDVTFAETPDYSGGRTVKFGGGAAIGVGPVLNRGMTRQLKKLAEKEKLAYQLEVLPGKSSTTADMAQISRDGVATALISLPLRYMHSGVELVSLGDIDSAASLLKAFLLDMGGDKLYA